jgi:Ribonuclease G/E
VSGRRFYIDRGIGESRGAVTLSGRPERLMLVREGAPAVQVLGARVAARVRSVDRALAIAFLDLGEGPDAILNLAAGVGPVHEGGWVEAEIKSEARGGKGASARWLGPATGPVRLLAAGPSLEDRIVALCKGAPIVDGPAARSAADLAQEEVLQTVFPLRGGGSIAVEATRALVAVDVDLGAAKGDGAKRAAREANIAALSEAARVLRLKGLGGLVVIDLAGRGQDGPPLLAAARNAFAPDNPGVALGPISRFGTLELTIPRRSRAALEILTDGSGAESAATSALALLRALEREAVADGGARLEAVAAPAIALAAQPFLPRLADRFGARLDIRADNTRAGYEVKRR